MSHNFPRARAPLFRVKSLKAWRKDQSGATAIEFGMLAMPFFIFALSIMGYGLYWLATSQLNHAATTASRQIRTGAAQRANKTVAEFKQIVCDNLVAFIECGDKLQVHVQSFDRWADVVPRSCISDSGSGLRSTGGSPSDSLTLSSGEASEIVLVTLCYKWDFAQSMPWLMLASKKSDGTNNLDGAALLNASAIFRTEPYQ
jgi:hypothetical protein